MKNFIPSCPEHFRLWMLWMRARINKNKAKEKINKHIEGCAVCQEKLKNKQSRG